MHVPVSCVFLRFSGRGEEHLRPHGSIDLVEEKPISPLGRHNSSFGETRLFQSSEVTPPLGTRGGGPLVDESKFVEVVLIEVEAKTKT